MTHSALYEGAVHHERLGPRPHRFRYRVFFAYLDLDELPDLFRGRWLWSARRPNVAWFRRADYLGPADVPLKQAVLDRVEAELGRRPDGAVRVLTQLRTFGYLFNPVSFYYCFGADGALEAVAAEITNTPWNERHTYVLDARTGREAVGLRHEFAKRFHVSPFHPMEQRYEWRLSEPGETLGVHMTNREGDRAVFHAGLEARRRPVTAAALAGALLRHPLLTLRVHAAIYWQAARLWAKRIPFHAHPAKRAALGDAPSS